MLSRISQCILISLVLTLSGAGQVPAGFHWVNFKTETETVAIVADALKGEEYSAIREIGIAGDSALVFTSLRDQDAPTPDYDRESVYNVSLKTGAIHKLVSGYELQFKNWIRFLPGGMEDLGMEYSSCSACEPIALYTALHFTNGEGWRARWSDESETDQPGISVVDTGAGIPYDDEEVDEIFSLFSPQHGSASAAAWHRSRNLHTGKITSELLHVYRVDPASQRDLLVTPKGAEADKWKWLLCRADHDRSAQLQQGQTTNTCKQFLRTHPRP